MSDSPFGDRNPPRSFDPEQSNGENAPENSGDFQDKAAEKVSEAERRARITSPESEGDRGFEVKREFGREVK